MTLPEVKLTENNQSSQSTGESCNTCNIYLYTDLSYQQAGDIEPMLPQRWPVYCDSV